MANIGLGCVQFGLDYGISNSMGKPGTEQIKEIIDVANDHGIVTFDTAPAYGNSELILGSVLPASSEVITKTDPITESIIGNNQVKKVIRIFFESLKNLKRDHVYGLLVHHSNDLLKPGSDLLYSEMQRLKRSAHVRKIGVSIYNSHQLDSILDQYDIDLVQLPLNIFDQRLLNSGHLDQLRKKGIEIHIRSVFLQGLLLMNKHTRPDYFLKYATKLDMYFAKIKKQGLSPLEAALGFVSALTQIDKIILGVNCTKELKEIIGASNITIDPFQFKDEATMEINLIDPSTWKI